jgi:F0F1-type ATP synthase membrane subunit b/b'
MLIIVFLRPSLSFASGAEEHHHGSPLDLIAPYFNFFIFALILHLKLKKKMQSHFVEKSKNIEGILRSADQSAKLAAAECKEYEDKIANLSAEKKKMLQRGESDAAAFSKRYALEIDEKIESMKTDSAKKLHSEQEKGIREIKLALVDQIMLLGRNELKGEPDLQGKLSKKMAKVLAV